VHLLGRQKASYRDRLAGGAEVVDFTGSYGKIFVKKGTRNRKKSEGAHHEKKLS